MVQIHLSVSAWKNMKGYTVKQVAQQKLTDSRLHLNYYFWTNIFSKRPCPYTIHCRPPDTPHWRQRKSGHPQFVPITSLKVAACMQGICFFVIAGAALQQSHLCAATFNPHSLLLLRGELRKTDKELASYCEGHNNTLKQLQFNSIRKDLLISKVFWNINPFHV